MRIHWKGFGRKGYGDGELRLEWNHLDNVSTYTIFRFVPDETRKIILFLRVPDNMSWQDMQPRIFEQEIT